MTSAAAFASLICAAGLIAMLGADSSGGLFQDQLSHGCGGVLGELIAPILLEPYVGLFGSYFILLMGFTVGSMIVFTDNLGRCVDYVQSIYFGFFERLTASKEARKALRAERAERKRIAKEEAAAAKAQAKADRSAADEDEFDQGQEDDRRPSLLPASMSSPAGLTRKAVKKKPSISKQAEPAAEVPDVLSEPVEDVEPAKPKFDPSMIKVVSEQKSEKAVASIPERRGDYVFPPLSLLAHTG